MTKNAILFFLLTTLGTCDKAANSTKIYSTLSVEDTMSGRVEDDSWEKTGILPRDVVPINYDLFLDPHIDDEIFYGRVNISIKVLRPTSTIVLHVKHLNVTSTQAFTDELTGIGVRCSYEDKKNEFWVVRLEKTLPPGFYSLKLEFSGSLVGSIVGFYKSSYTLPNKKTSAIVSTKFEPTYARRAFPCFDEPSYKATYDVKLVRPSQSYTALSNMNQIGEEDDYPSKGRTTVKFATTPPMASYLACFIVCDFPSLPPLKISSSNTQIRVFAREGLINNTNTALTLAATVLDYFSDYFGIPFPLPKLDLIAVPDFVSGAMENWGLITFRESRMVFDSSSSAQGQMAALTTVTHELAHMWFGDLVTMSWWDDLWLNEGFATFLATSALHKIHPSHEALSQFILGSLQSVLIDDATLSSHPIIQPVNHPDQITEIFDSISYSKGSSVLRMIENYAPDSFRRAVSKYLEKYSYKNAKTADLWSELSSEFKTVDDLGRMLDTWTKQMGFPLVNVERVGSELVFEQTRCLSTRNATFEPNSSPFQYRWDIPLKFVTSRNPQSPTSLVFKLEQNKLKVKLPEGVTWYKVNPDQVGFYRVNYPESEWKSLSGLLASDFKVMSPQDRSNLIDDAFSLADSGHISYSVPLSFIGYMETGDEHWAPWATVTSHLSKLKSRLYQSPQATSDLKAYAQKLLKSALSDDSIFDIPPNATISEKLYKSTVIRFSCEMGNESTLKRMNEMFTAWIEKGVKPQADLRNSVYSYGMRMNGNKTEENWNAVWELYITEQDPQEKELLENAIASVENPKIINKLIELMKNEKYIRAQDYFIVMSLISRSQAGNDLVWSFLRNNWSYLVDRFTLNHRQFGRILPAVAKLFYSEKRLDELEAFLKANPEEGAGGAGRRRALEITKSNIVWIRTNMEKLEKQLHELVK